MKLPKLPKPQAGEMIGRLRTRSFRVGGYSLLAAAIVIAIAVFANILVGALPAKYTQFDTSSSQLFTLSEQTELVLSGLEEEVNVYWIVQDGAEDTTLGALLERCEALSGELSVSKVDPDAQPAFVQQYVSGTLYNNSLVVECGERSTYVSYEDIYEYDYSEYYYTGSYSVSFAAEAERDAILEYLEAGGRLLLITGPLQDGTELTNLEAVSEYCGVEAVEGIVVEGSQNNYIFPSPLNLLPEYGSHEITSPLSSGGYYMCLPLAQGLVVTDTGRDGVSAVELLTTSDAAVSKLSGYYMESYEKEDGDIDGPFALAVAVTEGDAQFIRVSSAYLTDDAANQSVSGGNEDFFLNCISWLSAISEVTATKVIEGVSELADYGLDEPVCSITTDGLCLDIGGETGLDGLRYVSVGDGNVYLVSPDLLTNFSCGLYDLVSMESLPDMSELLSITVERPSGTLVIDHFEDGAYGLTDRYSCFAVDGDGYITLSDELAYSFIYQVTGLAWDSCVNYKAELKDLGGYGLDSPSVTVTVLYVETTEVDTNETDEDGSAVTETRSEEKSLTLELGSYADEGCYCRIAGSGMVYLIDSSVCDSLLYTSASELEPEELLLLDWDGMTGFDIDLGGESYAVSMEYSEDETAYVYGGDGEGLDFDGLLDLVEALPREGSAQGAQGLEELISLRFAAEGWDEVELTLYSCDSGSCLAVLNGEYYFTERSAAEQLRDSALELLSPED